MTSSILESIKKNNEERVQYIMEHPIENLMKTAMTNLKEMVDVNTIVGSPVSTADGNVVLTVSQVAFGFMPAEVTLKVILFPKSIITDKGSIKRTSKAIHLEAEAGLGFLLAQLLF